MVSNVKVRVGDWVVIHTYEGETDYIGKVLSVDDSYEFNTQYKIESYYIGFPGEWERAGDRVEHLVQHLDEYVEYHRRRLMVLERFVKKAEKEKKRE